MSEDEVVVTIASLFVGPLLWLFWLLRLRQVTLLRPARGTVVALTMALSACAVVILAILRTLASFDVVDSPTYQFMYVVLGLAWLRVSEWFFTFAGISARDDVVERRNKAAVPAWIGALTGVSFCYAGGNIGDGPGWWVVFFAAGLATATLFAAWLALGRFGNGIDALTIDRDPAAGVRLGAFLAAAGLVLGRSVAGDWYSAAQTVIDMSAAFPALILMLVAAVITERIAQPTAQRPHAPLFIFGLAPAVFHFVIAASALSAMGWPE